MLQLSLPFETDTVLTYQTFEPIVGIVVVEGTDILARTFVETILQFDIVEECIIIVGCILHFCTGRNLATHTETQAVVEEPLGKLKVVIGVHGTCCIGGVIYRHTDIHTHRTHRRTCNIIDL